MKKILYLSFAAALFLTSCEKDVSSKGTSSSMAKTSFDEMNVPSNFDWQINQTVTLDLTNMADGTGSEKALMVFDERDNLLMMKTMRVEEGSKLYIKLPKGDEKVWVAYDEYEELFVIRGDKGYLLETKGGGKSKRNNSKRGKSRKGRGKGKGGNCGTPPTPPPSCDCEGKMKSFTVVYNGNCATTFYLKEKVTGHYYTTVYSIPNIQPGDTVTFNGFDHKGRLNAQSFVTIKNNTYSIHTSCSEDILGNTYGPIKVIGYTDGEGAVCGPTAPCVDTDGDGCCDEDDAFPNDPTKCDIQYIPGEDVYGSYAFEDLWPYTGDFDYNDVVMDRTTALILDANGDVVEAEHKFVLKAAGAGYDNGFGFAMPNTTPAEITSVSSSHVNPQQYTVIDGKGLESGQTQAVVILYENWRNIVTYTQTGTYFNTITGANGGKGYADTITVNVDFSTPQLVSDVLDIDPFVIRNGNRGIEIHLPWFGPTDLADLSKFGIGQDSSAYPGAGNNYVNSNNIPWGIETPLSAFNWPKELVRIDSAYYDVVSWATTGSPTDWYSNGNNNPALLY